jgi:hypothetical protein
MFSHCKLGLRPHDPVRLSKVKALHTLVDSDPLFAQVPQDWAQTRQWDSDMLLNDQLGICGPAALINVFKLVADVSRANRSFNADDALAIYKALGYNGTPATDNGVVLLDLMEYAVRAGMLDCFFQVAFADDVHLATAIAMAGPLVAGFELPNSCQNTDRWDSTCAADKSVWGGHAVMIYAYSPGLLRAKSWGKPVDITPDFLAAKCNEMYFGASESLRVPTGLDYLPLLQLAGKL